MLKLGLKDFHLEIRTARHSFVCALGSEAKALEIINAAVNFMEVNQPSNEEILFHRERFVDCWIEEIFICMLVALFMASIIENLNLEIF